ncbi:MAG: hypothetical protein JWO76_1702 [Nocardioides sp.]|nr:hypothetical protein [Nocardioides sp.]
MRCARIRVRQRRQARAADGPAALNTLAAVLPDTSVAACPTAAAPMTGLGHCEGPHPQLVADPVGGWLLVTFDGTPYDRSTLGYGSHGDVVVLHSA